MSTENKEEVALNKFNFVTMDDLKTEKKDVSSVPDGSDKPVREEQNVEKHLDSISVQAVEEKPKENEQPISQVNDEKTAKTDKKEKEKPVPNPVSVFDERYFSPNEMDKKKKITSGTVTYPVTKKIHFSFEARVFILLFLIVLLFSSSCFLVFSAFHSNTKKTIQYDENSNIHYQVCFDPSSRNCLGEDLEYESKATDHINTSFQYKVQFSEDIRYDLAYHIIAVTKIYNIEDPTQVLYKNEDTIKDRTAITNEQDSIIIDEDVSLNYQKYYSAVMEYCSRYALQTSADVELILYLDENTETRNVASVVFPINNAYYKVSKRALSNNNREVEVVETIWNDYSILCIIIASVFMLFCLVFVYRITKLVWKVMSRRSKYQEKLSHILQEYDRIIVVARDGYESNLAKEIIKLDDFNKLLDVRDLLEKPIIYSRVNDIKSEFIVEDDEKLFKYVLKESD